MFTFTLIYCEIQKTATWYLTLNTFIDVMEYHEKSVLSRCAQWLYPDKNPSGDYVEQLNRKKIAQEGAFKFSERITGISVAMMQNLPAYVNANGGWMQLGQDHKIIREHKTEMLVWPETEFKHYDIYKWPKGKHFYAKLGSIDFVYNGKQKWNTKEGVESAIKAYLDDE